MLYSDRTFMNMCGMAGSMCMMPWYGMSEKTCFSVARHDKPVRMCR